MRGPRRTETVERRMREQGRTAGRREPQLDAFMSHSHTVFTRRHARLLPATGNQRPIFWRRVGALFVQSSMGSRFPHQAAALHCTSRLPDIPPTVAHALSSLSTTPFSSHAQVPDSTRHSWTPVWCLRTTQHIFCRTSSRSPMRSPREGTARVWDRTQPVTIAPVSPRLPQAAEPIFRMEIDSCPCAARRI